MIVKYRYAGQSAVVNALTSARVALATNTLREATFFEAGVRFPLQLREGLAALYDVVVSDYKYRPRDRLEFFAWLEEQDRKFLANLPLKSAAIRERLAVLELRRAELDQARRQRMKPFHEARKRFFDKIYTDEYELSLLLDPVITVHPDEVSFEAFSRDESSYARLAAKLDLFDKVDAFECGTTNIDFSVRLHDQLQRMRSYRQTRFDVAPSGFGVQRGGEVVHKEKKIELPESWVQGFLQVHSVMTMGLLRLPLAPVDLYNICRAIRRRRARSSPRALRYELEPGRPLRAVLEPWEQVIELSESPVFAGDKPQTIRTWGRERLRALGRLLPVCERVDLYLAGFGLPSIYALDLGVMSFTLALSGWTDNDWTGESRFSLLTRRLDAQADELQRVYEALRARRLATAGGLAQDTGLGVEQSRSAVAYLCQVGRAMYDLHGGVFRHRDLFFEPFSAAKALAMAAQAAEESTGEGHNARLIFERDDARIIARRPVKTGFKLSGSVKGTSGQRVRPLMHVDHEGRVIEASCTCPYFTKHKLTKGPCEHMLALRLAHMARLEQEDSGA